MKINKNIERFEQSGIISHISKMGYLPRWGVLLIER